MEEGWGHISVTVFQDCILDCVKTETHPDFPQCKAFDLVRSGAPVYRRHETLPDALDELVLGKW